MVAGYYVCRCHTLISIFPYIYPLYITHTPYISLTLYTPNPNPRFDCVYPTRTGRFGVALVESGTMRLKARDYSGDKRPIEVGCNCPTCRTVSRGYLHGLLKEDDALAAQYITLHNVSYMMRLMRSMREVSVCVWGVCRVCDAG